MNQTSYFIYKGEPMGFHFELLKRFADKLDLELEIITSNDIDEALGYLQSGDVDLVAIGLSVTADRKEMMRFTEPLIQSSQILVQRKPNGWPRMTPEAVAKSLVTNQLDLADKAVYVQKGSSYAQRLYNLERESGMDIAVIEVPYDAEELARQVARGEIEYTVCDDYMANIIGSLHPDLDLSTPVSFPLNIAWSVRKEGTDALMAELNSWITGFKTTREYAWLEAKYFSGVRPATIAGSEFFATASSGKVSPYDEIIKSYSDSIGWDWRLVAALIYQESRFNPSVRSPRGAYGLMQVMPETGRFFGYDVTRSVESNIRAGISYIKMLDRLFSEWVSDPDERIKFILASYNAGHGHVLDAIRLAEKEGLNPGKWKNVSLYLERKADPLYYADPVVRNGRLKQGVQVNAYVADILKRWEHYRNIRYSLP